MAILIPLVEMDPMMECYLKKKLTSFIRPLQTALLYTQVWVCLESSIFFDFLLSGLEGRSIRGSPEAVQL